MCRIYRRMYIYGCAKSVLTLTGLHSKVNTLIETTRKPSVATRLRDLVAGDGGFTLLETLAVMVIIGLLAAITVPQIAKWREKAYITSLKTDARNIGNAIEAFYVDDQLYPTDEQFTTLITGADVKLNPGNSSVAADYTVTGQTFIFKVKSNKTTKVATYSSAPVSGKPTIEVP